MGIKERKHFGLYILLNVMAMNINFRILLKFLYLSFDNQKFVNIFCNVTITPGSLGLAPGMVKVHSCPFWNQNIDTPKLLEIICYYLGKLISI